MLQAWSTATVHMKNRPIAPTARIFSSIMPPSTGNGYFPALSGSFAVTPITPSKSVMGLLLLVVGRFGKAFLDRLVSAALQDRQSRIFWKFRLGEGPLTEVESRAAVRFHAAYKFARRAKSDARRLANGMVHTMRISRHRASQHWTPLCEIIQQDSPRLHRRHIAPRSQDLL